MLVKLAYARSSIVTLLLSIILTCGSHVTAEASFKWCSAVIRGALKPEETQNRLEYLYFKLPKLRSHKDFLTASQLTPQGITPEGEKFSGTVAFEDSRLGFALEIRKDQLSLFNSVTSVEIEIKFEANGASTFSREDAETTLRAAIEKLGYPFQSKKLISASGSFNEAFSAQYTYSERIPSFRLDTILQIIEQLQPPPTRSETVLELRSVRNQHGPTCWLNAGELNFEYWVNSAGEPVPDLSVEYMMAQELLDQTFFFVTGIVKDGPNFRAKTLRAFEGLAQRHGTVPSSEFQTTGIIDWSRIQQRLSAYAKEMSVRFQQANDSDRQQIRAEVIAEVSTYIQSKTARFPEKFKVGNKEYTPTTYYGFLASSLTGIESVIPDTPENLRTTFKSWDMKFPEGLPKMLVRIDRAIKQKRSVLTSLRWSGTLKDMGSGHLVYSPSSGSRDAHKNHAITIVGHRKLGSQITHLILQNSWGGRTW